MNGTLRGSACEVSFCSRANSSFRKETVLAGDFPGFSPRRSHLEKLHLHLLMSSVLSISQMRMRPSRDQQLLSLPLPSNDLKISWFHSVIEVSPRQYPLRKVQLDAMHHPRTHFDLQLRSVLLDFEDTVSKRLSLHIIRFVMRLLRGPKRSRDDCSLWPNLSKALFITAHQLKHPLHVSHVHFAKRQAAKSLKYPLEPRLQDRALCVKLLQSTTTAITLFVSQCG